MIQPRLERVQNSAGHEQVAQVAHVTVQATGQAGGPGELLEKEQEPMVAPGQVATCCRRDRGPAHEREHSAHEREYSSQAASGHGLRNSIFS